MANAASVATRRRRSATPTSPRCRACRSSPVYGPDDGEFPGEYPYTRGPYASMYRSKLWTMRMFAGFGTAVDTNRRFHDLLAAGGDGLSTAFDLPTLMGRDSDDALALGEVGKCGVAVDTLADVEDLYRGIDLGAVTTSMTINGPAAIVFAMFVANAEANGVDARAARRHAPERHPEGVPGAEGVHLPAAPVAAARPRHDHVLHGRDAEVAHDLGVRLPHPRSGLDRRAGARVHARERLRVRRARARGRTRRRRVRAAPLVLLQRARRLLRGDRQVPRRPSDLGALDARPLRRAGASGRCSCGSTPRPPACRSPRSSPRSTSCAPRSRRSPACSAARRACTRTRWTRRSRCRPRRPPASRCGPSR